jgi:hypothetical protein
MERLSFHVEVIHEFVVVYNYLCKNLYKPIYLLTSQDSNNMIAVISNKLLRLEDTCYVPSAFMFSILVQQSENYYVREV